MTAAGLPLRAIAVDLDGTLLDASLAVHPENARALKAAGARGVPVFLVTGRHHIAARAYHHQLALTTPLVCCNGLYLQDVGRDQTLQGDPLPTPVRLRLLERARRHGLHMLAYLADRFCYERSEPVLARLMAWAEGVAEPLRPRFEQVDDLAPVLREAGCVWKLALSHDDARHLAAVARELADDLHLGVVQTGPLRLDVGMPGHDKATGLSRALADHGLTLQDVLAFGDQHNDIPMLSRAGHGVAMAESPPAVIAAAHELAGSHCGPAIAEVMARLQRAGRLP